MESYAIRVSGLKLRKHSFEWKVDGALFEEYGVDAFSNVALQCDLELEKKERLMQLDFFIKGSLTAPCDRCGEPVAMDVELENDIVVRFAEETDLTDDHIVFLSEAEHIFNISQFIYEFVMTGLPARFVHDEGACDPYVESFLEESDTNEELNEGDENNIDPRWEALKNLKTKD
jgi:uncharacterized metal-binding protein YceD (DUF177 family)